MKQMASKLLRGCLKPGGSRSRPVPSQPLRSERWVMEDAVRGYLVPISYVLGKRKRSKFRALHSRQP